MTWKSWLNKLCLFEKWRHQKINPLVRAWWFYLFRMFFHEVQSIAASEKYTLDIGCGHGDYLMEIIKRGGSVGIGIDPLKSSLISFKNRIKGTELYHKIEIIRGVGENIPMRGNCVSICVMTGTLDHVNDPKSVLHEIYRVLVFKGYLILLETVLLKKRKGFYSETHMHDFTIMDLKNYLKHFKIMKLTKFYPVFSQIRLGFVRELLDSFWGAKVLCFIPGFIGRYFNYSVVLAICRKN